MPPERTRKRGRRRPKDQDEAEGSGAQEGELLHPETETHDHPPAGPSSVHPSRQALLSRSRLTAPTALPTDAEPPSSRPTVPDSQHPFGILNPDLKAYFRTVEDQIRDWQSTTTTSSGEEREDRQNFLSSVLAELRGNELLVATDPLTAVVLERLMPSLGDLGRRVVGDAFSGNWEGLIRHRFGSHVVQTWLTLAAQTLDREAKGNWPAQQVLKTEEARDVGELPTMAELLNSLVESLSPSLSSLLINPQASPPLRLLLLVLTPHRELPTLEGGADDLTRSKKSNKYRQGQKVHATSILEEEESIEKGKGKAALVSREVPEEVARLRKRIRLDLMSRIGPGEWMSMSVDPVGSAAIQLLLEMEVEDGESEQKGSLLDQLMEGVNSNEPRPFLSSLLGSQIGTRLVETMLRVAPMGVFSRIWQVYFVGKNGRLAVHPYANFVVARGVSRLDGEGIAVVVSECQAVSGGRGIIKTARTSVLQALVERAGEIRAGQASVVQLIRSSLDLPDGDKSSFVPCLMALKTYPDFQAILTGQSVSNGDGDVPDEALDPSAEDAAAAAARQAGWKSRRQPKAAVTDLTPNVQGCLLLQGLVGMGGDIPDVFDSLFSQPVEALLSYAKHPIASRLLDAILTKRSVPLKYKRKIPSLFLGKYRELAEDRIGSRVAENIWDSADGYMREKIARSLVPDTTALSNSAFGRFLSYKLNLQLLARRPEEWKTTVLNARNARPGLGPSGEAEKLARRVEGLASGAVGGHVDRGLKSLDQATRVKSGEQAARAGERATSAGRDRGEGIPKSGGEEEGRKRRPGEEGADEMDALFAGVKVRKRRKA